jgi:hypothetical protein
LVTSKVCVAVDPRTTSPKLNDVVETLKLAEVPVPDKVTEWDVAPSLIVMEPVAAPLVTGLKVTLTVQELPGATAVQLCVAANVPLVAAAPVMVTGTVPVFRRDTPSTDELPTLMLPKSKEIALVSKLSTLGAKPLPLKVTDFVPSVEPVMLKVPGYAWTTKGLNDTVAVQKPPASRVAPQSLEMV